MTARAILISFVTLLICSCGSKPPVMLEENIAELDAELVRADGVTITTSDLRERLNQSELLPQGGIVSVEAQQPILDSILLDTLVGLKALDVNLGDHPIPNRTYQLRRREYLTNRFLEERVRNIAAKIDSAEIVTYMEKYPESFTLVGSVQISQILIVPGLLTTTLDSNRFKGLEGDDLDTAVTHYVQDLRNKINSPDEFAEIARIYSHDSRSRLTGGYVGWATKGEYFDPFDSIAFSMEPGEISAPYRDKDGWHILLLMDALPAGLIDLGKYYDMAVQNAMALKSNEMGRKVTDSLIAAMHIKYNEKILPKDIYYEHDDQWVAVVNDLDTITAKELKANELNQRNQFKVPNTTPEMKKGTIKQAALKRMFVRAALAMEIHKIPADSVYLADMKQKYRKVVVREDMYDPAYEPDEDLLRYYYDLNIDQFTVSRPYTVQQIVVPDSITGEFIRDQAMAGIDFLDLAEQYYPGDPAVRRELADLGPIGPDDVSPELYAAVRILTVGEVSHPVKTDLGYQIVKLLKIEQSTPFENARGSIATLMKRDHEREVKEAFKNTLFDEYHVKYVSDLVPIHLKPIEERSTE